MSKVISKKITPKWNLDDLYTGMQAPKISSDLAEVEGSAKAFASRYRGKLKEIDDINFGQSILEYENITEVLARLLSYAQLLFAANAENPDIAAFYQDMTERVTEISSITIFYELEINRFEDAVLSKKMNHPTANKFKSWIETKRAYKPYQLTDDLEKLFHEKFVTGRASWSRLFDETMAGMRFEVDGREISNSQIMSKMSDKDYHVKKKSC